jgi:hypothetical protein
MLYALTVRTLKPGTFEDFKAALRGGPIWPGPDAGNAPLAEGFKRFGALRNLEDENEVITFAVFDGSLEELRARQTGGSGYGLRRQATDAFVEAKIVDGVFEVLAERSAD